MATVKLDREEEPDYDEAQDVSYDEGADPEFDESRQPDYNDDFADPDADAGGNQEWYARKQK